MIWSSTPDRVEVAVIGGGAAGITAARTLCDSGVDVLLIEARDRLGGRAWTISEGLPCPLDLGCGWLHSGDRNPWVEVAEELGLTIDRTAPPWARAAGIEGFSPALQKDFTDAAEIFHNRLERACALGEDHAASEFLQIGCRWNPLLEAVGTYYHGASLRRVSVRDFGNFIDTQNHWRVREGYGALIAAHASGLPVVLECPVTAIDHSGRTIRLSTPRGVIEADAVIVTVSSNLIARETIRFFPALPAKTAAAARLPLGNATKVMIALDQPDELPIGTRLFGDIDSPNTGTYHLRPSGRPVIEGYFGGDLAVELDLKGEQAGFDFAAGELVKQLGAEIRPHLSLLAASRWSQDPWALGSYSHSLPGSSEMRGVLAEPVDERLYFAGEACSRHSFSTAHGAYETGEAAARELIAHFRPAFAPQTPLIRPNVAAE